MLFEKASTLGQSQQDWDLRVILLLPQTAVKPRSDAGSDGVKPLGQHRALSSKPGFPKLLVHRDTVAGLHVPPKFCDVSLKKKGFQLES